MADALPSMDAIRSASASELSLIEGVGQIIAEAIRPRCDAFMTPEN